MVTAPLALVDRDVMVSVDVTVTDLGLAAVTWAGVPGVPCLLGWLGVPATPGAPAVTVTTTVE